MDNVTAAVVIVAVVAVAAVRELTWQRVMGAHGGSLTVERRTGGLRIRRELPVAMRDAAAEAGREKAERPPGEAASSPGR
jgi:hypothetical protein